MDADALDNATRAEAGGADAPAVSGMSDLPQLRRALASDAYADNASSCLHSMAKLAQQLPRAELPALQNDPLLQEVLTIMDTRMHQFTAYRLAMCLWSFGHLQLVPSRCAFFCPPCAASAAPRDTVLSLHKSADAEQT